jgi:methylated-DNA-protein-cysteine methyltransferase-like protein
MGEMSVDFAEFGWFPRRLPSAEGEGSSSEEDEDDDE